MANIRKSSAEISTITRDITQLDRHTANIYESLSVISRRASQIQVKIKEEVQIKLQDFVSQTDNLEEVLENREQIEISRFYEKLPKAHSIAYQEWLENQIYFRNPDTGKASEGEENA